MNTIAFARKHCRSSFMPTSCVSCLRSKRSSKRTHSLRLNTGRPTSRSRSVAISLPNEERHLRHWRVEPHPAHAGSRCVFASVAKVARTWRSGIVVTGEGCGGGDALYIGGTCGGIADRRLRSDREQGRARKCQRVASAIGRHGRHFDGCRGAVRYGFHFSYHRTTRSNLHRK